MFVTQCYSDSCLIYLHTKFHIPTPVHPMGMTCVLSESVLQAEGSTGVNHEPQAGVDGSSSNLHNSSQKERVRRCCCRSRLLSVVRGPAWGSTWELVRRQKLHLTRPLGDPCAQEGTGLICSEVSRRVWLLRIHLHTKFHQELPKWRRIQFFKWPQ